MKGRYCVKSSDQWWLYINFSGQSEFMQDPLSPEPATSFFGKPAALEAMKRHGLPSIEEVLKREGFKTYEEMRAAGNDSVCWAPVPDPNP